MARMILNETSYFGKGAISNVAAEVKARGLQKVLLVTDKALVKFNVATKVMKVMVDAGIPYTVYDDIKANPTIQMSRKVWSSARKSALTASWQWAAAASSTPARPLASS